MGLDLNALALAPGHDDGVHMPGWDHAPAGPFAGIDLIGASDRTGTFAGKCYVGIIQRATGVDPFAERPYEHLDPETVADMASKLATYDLQDAIDAYPEAAWWADPSRDTMTNLRRWFDVCAEHGYAIRCSW